tara:strand:+ start:933 stop:1238 length:306 start_codon:yes stop_codon:yes gene_type:complete
MRKFLVITLIFFLILITAIIKNSTKNIEDDIFVKKEILQELKKDLGDIQLEFNYLSSSEKLIEYHDLYFDEKLSQIKFEKIQSINFRNNKINITKIVLANE